MKIENGSFAAVAALGIATVVAGSQSTNAAVLIRNDFATINVAYDGSIGTVNADGSPVVPAKPAGDRFMAPWVNASGIEGNQSPGSIGLTTTYDHDNDAGTAEVNVPGFLEVNGWDGSQLPGSLIVTAAFPSVGFEAGAPATLTFWAAARESVTGGTVQFWNATDNVQISDELSVDYADTATSWQFNSFSFTQAVDLAGKDIQVIFRPGTSDGAAGLELTDITLDSTDAIPEPASIGLLGIAGLAVLRRRR